MLFIEAPKWKQLKCPSIGEWINKLEYIHKQNITHPEKRINDYYLQQHGLNFFMVSDKSQNEKTNMDNFIYMTFLCWKKPNYWDRKQISSCQDWSWGKKVNKKGNEGTFGGVINLFYVLIVVMVTQLYALVKNHRMYAKQVVLWCVYCSSIKLTYKKKTGILSY